MFFSWSIPYDITRNWQLFFIYFSRFIFIHHFHRLLGKKNIFLKNRLKPTANDNSKKNSIFITISPEFLAFKIAIKRKCPKIRNIFLSSSLIYLFILFIIFIRELVFTTIICRPFNCFGWSFFFLFFLISWYVFPVYFFTSFFCCCW